MPTLILIRVSEAVLGRAPLVFPDLDVFSKMLSPLAVRFNLIGGTAVIEHMNIGKQTNKCAKT